MAQVQHPGGRTCADFTDTNPFWLYSKLPADGRPRVPARVYLDTFRR